MEYLPSVLAVLAAYLIGSLSFAVIVSRRMALGGPRDYGSDNPGATNVLRSGNRVAALFAPFYQLLILAGQVAADAALDIRGQTRQVLAAIDALPARAGSDKSRLLMCRIFLADWGDFAGMNEVWEAWLPAGQASPRATVLAQLAKPQCKLEMMVTAAI